MLEILAQTEQGMQNVYTPLSLKTHFIFCAAATVLYLVLFYRRGSWHYLLTMAAIDLTFATQTSLCQTGSSIKILALIEVILLASSAFFCLRYSKQQKALLKAENPDGTDEKGKKDEKERRNLAEKRQHTEDKKIVDNAFEDGDEQ